MPRPKRPDYNPPPDLLDRLPVPTIVTRGDKLALLRTLSERAGSVVQSGVNRAILAGIERDIRAPGRAQKGSAPAGTGAPSRTVSRAEAESGTRSIVAQACLERKIGQDLYLRIEGHNGLNLYAAENDELLYCLSPDLARDLATALNELADDLEQDARARAWSKGLLEAITEQQ